MKSILFYMQRVVLGGRAIKPLCIIETKVFSLIKHIFICLSTQKEGRNRIIVCQRDKISHAIYSSVTYVPLLSKKKKNFWKDLVSFKTDWLWGCYLCFAALKPKIFRILEHCIGFGVKLIVFFIYKMLFLYYKQAISLTIVLRILIWCINDLMKQEAIFYCDLRGPFGIQQGCTKQFTFLIKLVIASWKRYDYRDEYQLIVSLESLE